MYRDQPELTEAEQAAAERNLWAVLQQAMASSPDLEHRLAAALVNSVLNYPNHLEYLIDVWSELPGSSLLSAQLLEACIESTDPYCTSGQVETEALQSTAANALTWTRVAAFRASRSDEAGALLALQRAVSAPEFDEPFSKALPIIFRGMQLQGDWTASQRLVATFNVALMVDYKDVTSRLCKDRSDNSEVWAETCLAYAVRLEGESKTVSNAVRALQWQQDLHELSGDRPLAIDASVRAAELTERRSQLFDRDAIVLLHAEDQVALGYLDSATAEHELDAWAFLQAEVERYSQIPGYDPCPPDSD